MAVFQVFLDIAILTLLGVTIYYAYTLSKTLRDFKSGRKDIDFLLQELSAAGSRAENVIQSINQEADQTSLRMQDIVKDAQFLADELKFMTEAGDSLANRLENLADRNRDFAERAHSKPKFEAIMERAEPKAKIKNMDQPPAMPMQKAIQQYQDPIFEDADDFEDEEDGFEIQDFEVQDLDQINHQNREEARDILKNLAGAIENISPQNHIPETPSLKSKAELELYNALRRKPNGRNVRAG